MGFECLCPDFAYLGRTRGGGPAQEAEARALWAAKCLTKCTDAAGQEVGCDVYHLRVISIQTKLLI